MLENPVVPGVSVASISAAGVSAAAGIVYFMRKRRNRSAPTNAEDGSDSWTRPPGR